jgi:hypothetical protein
MTELRRPHFSKPSVSVDEYSVRFEQSVSELMQTTAIDPLVIPDLELAARLAGRGAEDPRYQGFLRGGDQLLKYLQQDTIATLTERFNSTNAATSAQVRVGLPERWCRQAAAVAYAVAHDSLRSARDRRLVLLLIGTLLGTGCPLYPHTDFERAGPHDFEWTFEGQDWCQIFDANRRRYGWWGLAHLIAAFRLAEHRAWDAQYKRVGAALAESLLAAPST